MGYQLVGLGYPFGVVAETSIDLFEVIGGVEFEDCKVVEEEVIIFPVF